MKSLIQWIEPKELKIEFRNNELDEKDIEDLIFDGLLLNFNKAIRKVKIKYIHNQI